MISVSETFLTVQGEIFAGIPIAFVRFAGCNFTCNKFNNPDDKPVSVETLGYNPKDFNKLEDLPPVVFSCDSIYAHNKLFNHLWKKMTIDELAEDLVNLLPNKSWVSPSGLRYALSITGGEPTLHQKEIVELLDHPLLADVRLVMIETNCSLPLKQDFINGLNKWSNTSPLKKIIWSNSPKLSASGELWSAAIRPDVADQQLQVNHCEQYFKFVCGDSDTHFAEVKSALDAYRNADIPIRNNVYIMPMACVEEQQKEITTNVALRCIQEGYIYCHRVHLEIFGNAIGT